MEIEASASARSRIEENLRIVRENKQFGTCFFCEEKPTASKSELSVAMHGNVQTYYAGYNTTRTTWSYNTFTVPRCASCAKAHKTYAGARSVGGVFAFLSIVAFLVSLAWVGGLVRDGVPLVLYLGGLVAAIAGPLYLSRAVGRIILHGLQPEDKKYDYPTVVRRKGEGWLFGQNPPGFTPARSNPNRGRGLANWEPFRRKVDRGGPVFVTMSVFWLPALLGLLLLPPLAGLLGGGPEATRYLYRLGLLSKKSAVERLVDAIAWSRPARLTALEALEPILATPDADAQSAIPALAKVLESSEWRVRQKAALMLGEMGPVAREAIPALEKATTDSDSDVSGAANLALAKVAPEALVQRYMGSLVSSPDWKAREQAAQKLGAMGPVAHGAIPALERATRDSDSDVRNAANLALARVAPEAAVQRLTLSLKSSDWRVRQKAALSLGEMGPVAREAIPALERATRDPDNDVRSAAAQALEKVDLAKVVERLGSPSWQVRQAAAEALGRLGPQAKGAAFALENATRDTDPDVRRAAEAALQKVVGKGNPQ